MNIENNPLNPHLICEIEYFTAFSVLKKLMEERKSSLDAGQRANVAIAKQYGVSAYHI